MNMRKCYCFSAWVDYDTHVWPYMEYRMRYGEKDKAPQMFREGVEQADDEYRQLSVVTIYRIENWQYYI